MKLQVFISIILIPILLALDSGRVLAQVIAEVIESSGMELKRKDWQDYKPTSKGIQLERGDLIKVQRGAKGTIRCTSNSTVWTVPADGIPKGVANTCSPRS